MEDSLVRTRILLGTPAVDVLKSSRVAVFGVGGVGGYVCEALARCGVGALDLIDNDTVSESNLNRQIIALHSTIGMYKTDVMKARLLDINPQLQITTSTCFFLPENSDDFPFDKYDYIVDAVDTVTAKLELITKADRMGIPIISAMGTGNKLDPEQLHIMDLADTKNCHLARIMRRELRKRGIIHLKVAASDELALKPERDEAAELETQEKGRRDIPGSTIFVPAAAGLMIASAIVRDLTDTTRRRP